MGRRFLFRPHLFLGGSMASVGDFSDDHPGVDTFGVLGGFNESAFHFWKDGIFPSSCGKGGGFITDPPGW